MTNPDQEKKWLLEEKYNNQINQEYVSDCKKIDKGFPLAYIIGYQPFLNCTIYLDSKPLIPRSETEYWVDIFNNTLKTKRSLSSLKILDLCAGSGCCGVAIAKALPNAEVDFTEISTDHFETIKTNLEHNLSVSFTEQNQYQIIISDLFKKIEKKYDYIVCNPPYIDRAMHTVSDSVHNYEPHEALYGGEGGLYFIERILSSISYYLKPHGQLWLEHEPEHVFAITNICKQHNITCTTHTDQYKVPRFTVCNVSL